MEKRCRAALGPSGVSGRETFSINPDNLEPYFGDFIYTNYSPNQNCDRMYFTPQNAILIDRIRQDLNELRDKQIINWQEFLVLLKTLLLAVSSVSNTASVYGAYLKKFKKSAEKRLVMSSIIVNSLIPGRPGLIHECKNFDALVCAKMGYTEVVYIDPPYNTRNYSQNFHILETVTRYDHPEIKGITGLRTEENEDSKKFCSKINTYNHFKDIIDSLDCKYIFISYSSEGILGINEICHLLSIRFDDITLKQQSYKKFKSNKTNEQSQVQEYLICGKSKKFMIS